MIDLGPEFIMGMRAQTMGRNLIAFLDNLEALPKGALAAYLRRIGIDVTGDVPGPLASLKQSWAILPQGLSPQDHATLPAPDGYHVVLGLTYDEVVSLELLIVLFCEAYGQMELVIGKRVASEGLVPLDDPMFSGGVEFFTTRRS